MNGTERPQQPGPQPTRGPGPAAPPGSCRDVHDGPALVTVDLGGGARGWFTTRRAPGGGDGASRDLGFNLALHVGDDPTAVTANRAALEDLVGGPIGWMNQAHSATVAPARRDGAVDADGIVLDPAVPGAPAAVGVLVADCVPVLLAATDGSRVAAVHAGRRGMLDGVVTRAVEALAAWAVRPEDLRAVVGPSVCGACYEVPEDMARQAAAVEPACHAVTRWGTPGIDVAAGVRAQLERAGVVLVEAPGWCTVEDRRFFSYRREGATGRLAGVVAPRPPVRT